MPVRGNTYKIFIGNLSDRTTSEDVRALFEAHGTVVEADVVKNYGFVHMQNEEQGKPAIEALNGHNLHGKPMVVEASTGSKKSGNQKTKIFVGNLSKDAKLEQIKALFETYGRVVEGDMLTNFAFIHMDTEANTQEAIRNLDGYELNGMRLRVQESTSRVRQHAGMGNPDICFRCGSSGHWSKECPRDGRFGGNHGGGGGGGGGGGRYSDRMERRRGFGGRFDPYPPPPPGYGRERMRYRDDYDSYDRYDRFYEDSMYDRRYGARPPPPPLPEDMYDRRMPAPMPPSRTDYLRYGRRSPPPPRYPPPPPMRSSFGPPGRPF